MTRIKNGHILSYRAYFSKDKNFANDNKIGFCEKCQHGYAHSNFLLLCFNNNYFRKWQQDSQNLRYIHLCMN